jgi:hypothetical protein
MEKTLIAVAGCHQYHMRADAQRRTWMQDVGSAADVRFFLGTPHGGRPRADEIWLDCADNYDERKKKVLEIIRWALAHGYAYLWKIDDDVYLRPERLLSLPAYDFCRSMRGIGAIYGLSRSSMIALTTLPDTFEGLVHEDQWVSRRLRNAGIEHTNLGGVGAVFCAMYNKGTIPYHLPEYNEPRFDNQVIAAWEYVTPEQMAAVHDRFRQGPGRPVHPTEPR